MVGKYQPEFFYFSRYGCFGCALLSTTKARLLNNQKDNVLHLWLDILPAKFVAAVVFYYLMCVRNEKFARSHLRALC